MRWLAAITITIPWIFALNAVAQGEDPCAGDARADALSPILALARGETPCPDYRPGHSGLTFERYQQLVDEHDNLVFAANATAVDAVVTKYDPKYGRSTVEYTDSSGEKHDTWVHAKLEVGSKVPLWYAKDRPFYSRRAVELPKRTPQENAERLGAILDKELRAAIRDTFASPTRVYYGDYTPPPREGEGAFSSKDGLRGLRIIWEKTVRVGDQEHLITVITAARLNPTTRRFEIVTGPDSIRVRAELTRGLRFGRSGVASLSYGTTAADGKITRVEPGVYFTADGKARGDVAPQAHAEQCSGCHAGARRKNFVDPKSEPTEQFGYRAVLDYIERVHKGDAALKAAVSRQLADPKALIPPGVTDALAPCDDKTGS